MFLRIAVPVLRCISYGVAGFVVGPKRLSAVFHGLIALAVVGARVLVVPHLLRTQSGYLLVLCRYGNFDLVVPWAELLKPELVSRPRLPESLPHWHWSSQ